MPGSFAFNGLTKPTTSGKVWTIMTDFIAFQIAQAPAQAEYTCLAAPDNHCLAAEPDFAPPVLAMTRPRAALKT